MLEMILLSNLCSSLKPQWGKQRGTPKINSGNLQTQEDQSWRQKENNYEVPTKIIRAQRILKLK